MPQNGAEIKAVVWDIGAVLIEWDPRHLYTRLIPDPMARERFLAEIWSPAQNLRADAGTPFAQIINELAAVHPDKIDLIEAYFTRWDDMVPGAIRGSVDILEELRGRGVPCYAITNFSAETYPRACRRFPFLEGWDGIVVSGREGLVKPDPAIYQLLLDRHGLKPNELIFIDDRPENIAAAEALGMKGHLFQGAAPLRAALEGLCLLPRHAAVM